MSSYVVKDRTINRVLGKISERMEEYAYLASKYGYEIEREGELQRLGRDMCRLNVMAVEGLYEICEAGEFRALGYQPDYEPCSTVQAFKSLNCLKYQCSEEPAIRVPLYQFLVDLGNKFLYKIVTDMAEYDKAEWG